MTPLRHRMIEDMQFVTSGPEPRSAMSNRSKVRPPFLTNRQNFSGRPRSGPGRLSGADTPGSQFDLCRVAALGSSTPSHSAGNGPSV